MRKVSIKFINSRLYYSRRYLSRNQFYSFFSCNKNEQRPIKSKNDDFLIDESYNNVEFDEYISPSFSFDINIDDDKWKKKEEIEYNKFIEKTKKDSINPSTFFNTQKMTKHIKNTSGNSNYEKLQIHNKHIDNNISSNVVTSNNSTPHNVETFYEKENIYEDDINIFLKNSSDDITLQDGGIIKKLIYLDSNYKSLHYENKKIGAYLNSILDLLERGSTDTHKDENGKNEQNEEDKVDKEYEADILYKDNKERTETPNERVGGGHIQYLQGHIFNNIYEDPFSLNNLKYQKLVTNFTKFAGYYTNTFFKLIVENIQSLTYNNLVFTLNLLDHLNMKNMMRDLSYEVIKMLNKKKKSDQEDILQNANINKKENKKINDIENNIKLCVHYINILNFHSLYFCEFYDYLIEYINNMKNDVLCFFTLQCFTHSLRTKHYLDKIYFLCLKKIHEFNYEELKCMIYCFHRFCKEYSKFYDLSIDIIKNKYIHLLNMNLNFVQLLLKITNAFNKNDKYVELKGLIAEKIIMRVGNIQREEKKKKGQYLNNSTNVNTSVDMWTNVERHKKKESSSRMCAPYDTTYLGANSCVSKVFMENSVHNTIYEDNIIKIIQCLKYLEYNKKNSEHVKTCVNKIYEMINENMECLEKLDIEDIVYSIVCFSTYNKRLILYNNFLDIIYEKSNELMNAKNICLWIYPILSLCKISWYHRNYIELLFGYIKDNYILNRLSVFQVLKLLSSIVKMNIYDEEVYKILIEKLYKEWDIIKKKLIDISTFLWCCAYINIIYKPLFDSAYNLIIDLINKDNVPIINNVMYKNCFVNITWSFIVANYHKTHTNFDQILNITFLKRNPNENEAFKRLHQISDSCFKEIPKTLINITCLDTLYAYCTHEKCKLLRNNFIIYKKEKDAVKMKNKIHDELINLLKNSFHISFDQYVEPYHNSPYIIDICLNQTSKIGVSIFGKEYLMRTLKKSSWDFMNTGIVTLQMRILHAHGWKIIPINAGEWLQLNFDQKKNLLSEYFKQYSIQI
ncbi:hypothetical protein PFMALIP_01125 [Plasmodium falciparum MaliPS096_E11]|uniref:RAP domain-containing protein n=1 Tax=Plasmodium falciparum MaliPS096_E11 TaxID=1036727 RepID=A0A024WUF5_PLAFA|nr:hypothetical protein PFMALIP_01125 [Plasmodium falciparum MaliPS096_E11]